MNEIFSEEIPWSHIGTKFSVDILDRVERGERPVKNFSEETYKHKNELCNIIDSCWMQDPNDRPSMKEVLSKIECIISKIESENISSLKSDSNHDDYISKESLYATLPGPSSSELSGKSIAAMDRSKRHSCSPNIVPYGNKTIGRPVARQSNYHDIIVGKDYFAPPSDPIDNDKKNKDRARSPTVAVDRSYSPDYLKQPTNPIPADTPVQHGLSQSNGETTVPGYLRNVNFSEHRANTEPNLVSDYKPAYLIPK